MLALLRLARRSISRRFLQSLLFILGVALGVAMVIAIDIANGSAKRAFALSTESVTGRATHQIVGNAGGVPTSLYRQIRVDLGLRESAPIVTDYIRATDFGNQPLRLLGVDPFAEPPFRSYLASVNADGEAQLGFAALTQFIAEPNTALVSQSLADRYGVSIGETVTVGSSANQTTLRIVGLLQPDDRASAQALSDLVLTDIATAQEITGIGDQLTRIDLILPTDGLDDWLARIQAVLPTDAQLVSVSAGNDTLAQMTAAFELNLQALSLLALVVGVFLIYNTVTFNVVQRRPVIGIMRAVGAEKQQIFVMIVGEALLLGAAGTILGIGLGIIFGRASVGLVAQTISDLYFTINVQGIAVDTFTLVKGVVIGLFASVTAAALPAYEATRTPPAGIMRRSLQEEATQRLVPVFTFVAVALNIAGLVLLQIPSRDIIISFAALFCIVVGSAFFTPIVLVLAMRALRPITEVIFGLLGRMAPRAVTRSLSRTSIAVAALTIAISVIVGVSVMISSFRSTVSDWLQTTLGADIYISPPLVTANRNSANVEPSLRERVAATEGVERVVTSRSVNVTALDYPDLPAVSLQAVESDIAGGRNFIWNSAPNGDYEAAMADGAVIVSEPFAYRRGITQDNAELTLVTDTGEHTFPIVGVFYDYTTDQGTVFMLRSVYDQYWDDPYITSAAAFIEPTADVNQVIANLREDALTGYDVTVQANNELRSGVFQVFDNAFSITIALRLLATVVAFIGILSALLSLQLENTRQYGLMRAVGMTPRQLWDFTLIQTGLMGIVAGLLALPIGLALALVLLYVINVRSFGWTMQLQLAPGEFLQAFGVAALAALLAGVYPAWRITRLVLARALRSE
jgi:putative ABC transport system permease protein